MNFLLQHTNKWDERHYFVATGATHFSGTHERVIHLIAATTSDKSKARVFDTEEQANTVLASAGGPPGWDVVGDIK